MENINKNMPVVILCGGAGTRLKEETEYKPKPMVTIGGKPILWHIMKIYSHSGFNKFIVCLGYKGQMIKDYFLNHQLFHNNFKMNMGKRQIELCDEAKCDDFEIVFADTGDETLTAERVKMVEKYIKTDHFMVTYGDGVANVDINKLAEFYFSKNVIGVLTGVHPDSKYGMVAKDENHFITSFTEKPRMAEYVNGGFMIFRKDFFKYLKSGQMLEKSLEDLAKDRQLAMYAHDGFWQGMDTYKDYEYLNKLWQESPHWMVWKE